MAGPGGDDLSAPTGQDSVAILRARLARTEQQAAARQRQLERYAADLREVFKQERTRAQELRRSYRATVRALSNAVEAREEISRHTGSQFDPTVVSAYKAIPDAEFDRLRAGAQ